MKIVGQGGVPTTTYTFTDVNGGQTSLGIYVQGMASSGSALLTVSANGYNTGSGTVMVTPSGFVLSGPNGIGVPSFSTGIGTNVTVTVTVAQLDSNFNFIQSQSLAPNCFVVVVSGSNQIQCPSTNVTVTSVPTSVGTISSSPLTFSSGVTSLTTQFNAVAVGTATLTAVVPTGFATPANSGNVIAASVTPAGLIPTNATVGNGLEATASVSLNGVATGGTCSLVSPGVYTGGLTVTVTSNNPSQLQLAVNPTDAGSTSIAVCINGGLNHTPAFYVYGGANSGSPTYTATAPGFGSANGTVTLMPGGFIVAGPFGIGGSSFPTSPLQPPSTITVYSAQLDQSFNFVTTAQVAGTAMPSVHVTSGTTSVGTITTSPLIIAGGTSSATTQFVPVAAGTSVISVSVPAGFSAPNDDGSVLANVSTPGFAVTDGVSIGNNLEIQAAVVIGQLAGGSGQPVLLTSNNPGQLLLSATATGTGSNSLMLTIPTGTNNVMFYLQAVGGPATVSYTASADGFTSRTGTITITGSAVVISGPNGESPFDATIAGGAIGLTVTMAQLDINGNFVQTQTLAGGLSVLVNIGDSNSSVATAPTSVTIMGGSTAPVNFTPVAVGQATISIMGTPTGYTATPPGYGSVAGYVTM